MPALAYNRGCARKAGTNAQADLAHRLARSADELSTHGRKKLGFALYQSQIGQRHESAKMLHGFTETVWQVRADDLSGTYRAVYIAQLGEAIYVLHAFQKKATFGIATPKRDFDLIRQRLQLARKLAGK
jgi:phage-related protein